MIASFAADGLVDFITFIKNSNKVYETGSRMQHSHLIRSTETRRRLTGAADEEGRRIEGRAASFFNFWDWLRTPATSPEKYD